MTNITASLPLILIYGGSLLLAGLAAGSRGVADVQALHLSTDTAPDAACRAHLGINPTGDGHGASP
jgi:hypothetical protein